MGRLLGLDVGERRTGMAATDELQMICSPLRTVDTRELVEEIKRLQSGSPLDAIVVGRPHFMVGGADDSTPHIDRVVDTLTKAFPGMPIHFVDEGFTSQEASAIQRQGGMKSSKRREKGSLDAIAASLILQRHLDAQAYK
ncbi:MAG: Holliday junction resolvase RuvX [Flavobacteriales bacterium]|nr:Holliday junction resolvase RuvX [Flavobacteriales bacterium]